ncbi:hypothetical protein B0H34DRAFT_811469 [Crassisporium funariophilum]|nr:hypothetical protein B0H34DRAFT_811469 [Crassisporium funariophilum]
MSLPEMCWGGMIPALPVDSRFEQDFRKADKVLFYLNPSDCRIERSFLSGIFMSYQRTKVNWMDPNSKIRSVSTETLGLLLSRQIPLSNQSRTAAALSFGMSVVGLVVEEENLGKPGLGGIVRRQAASGMSLGLVAWVEGGKPGFEEVSAGRQRALRRSFDLVWAGVTGLFYQLGNLSTKDDPFFLLSMSLGHMRPIVETYCPEMGPSSIDSQGSYRHKHKPSMAILTGTTHTREPHDSLDVSGLYRIAWGRGILSQAQGHCDPYDRRLTRIEQNLASARVSSTGPLHPVVVDLIADELDQGPDSDLLPTSTKTSYV